MCEWESGEGRTVPRRRSQSDVIAVVLLAGMVIAGATAVVLAGSNALGQTNDEASFESATQAMQSFADQIQDISEGETSQKISLKTQDGDLQMKSKSPSNPATAGRVTVTVDPPSGPNQVEQLWLGTVRYEQGKQTVAFQGGGVWRRTQDGSVVVTPPDISYRQLPSGDGTLNFPVVTLKGGAVGSDVRLEKAKRTKLLSTLGLNNPIDPNTRITIEIKSEFYRAWADTLRKEIKPGAVSVTPADQKVTVTLKSPPDSSVPSSILGTNPSGTLAISNFGTTDSFDSSNNPYPAPPSSGFPVNNNADVLTQGTIDGSNKMSVHGDLVVESGLSNMKISGKVEVFGRTVFGDDPDIGNADYITVKEGSSDDQNFHGLFSIQDNLKIKKGTDFEGDLLVGGDLKVTASGSHMPQFQKDVVVTGKVEKITNADISGDLIVDGDASRVGTSDLDVQGDLVVNGHLDLDSGAHIHGNVVVPAGSSPNIAGGATIDGSVQYVDFSTSGDAIDTAPRPITPDVPPRPSASTQINSLGTTLASSNDNGDEPLITTNDRLDFGPTSDYTLGSGEYYLKQLKVPDDKTLTLDTNGGDVVIYVSDSSGAVEVNVKGRIEVDGQNPDSRVRIYVDDPSGGDPSNEFYVDGESSDPDGVVDTPQDRTGNLWLYTKPTADVGFANHAVFEGVLYGANGGSAGGAEIALGNHAQVYGSLIGDVTNVPNHAQVHYDESLSSQQAFAPPTGTATIGFLHLSQHTTKVEN